MIDSDTDTRERAARGSTVIDRAPPVRIREGAFRDAVVQYARLRNWRCYWTWRSDHSPAGFPDLVLVRGRSIVYAELKVRPNKPTTAQREWLEALDLAGAETYLWYPENWDAIEIVLGTPEPAAGSGGNGEGE